MKISVDDYIGEDRERAKLAERAIVFLDGVEVNGCIEANEEEGYIIKYIPETDPRFKRELKELGQWPTERFEGKVEIIDPEKL